MGHALGRCGSMRSISVPGRRSPLQPAARAGPLGSAGLLGNGSGRTNVGRGVTLTWSQQPSTAALTCPYEFLATVAAAVSARCSLQWLHCWPLTCDQSLIHFTLIVVVKCSTSSKSAFGDPDEVIIIHTCVPGLQGEPRELAVGSVLILI